MPKSVLRSTFALAMIGALAFGLAGCAAKADIEGVWDASDGSAAKVIEADGSCSGMYYTNGRVLDIGGPETCTLSKNAVDGFYDLEVRQPPNQETLRVRLDGDTMQVYSGNTPVVTLTRR